MLSIAPIKFRRITRPAETKAEEAKAAEAKAAEEAKDSYYIADLLNKALYDTDDEDSDEAGLMDYRQNDIKVVNDKKNKQIHVTLIFSCECLSGKALKAWCAKFDPSLIASECCTYNISFAKWVSNRLIFTIENKDGKLKADEIESDLSDNSLEDGPYEGFPGEGFWVLSKTNLK